SFYRVGRDAIGMEGRVAVSCFNRARKRNDALLVGFFEVPCLLARYANALLEICDELQCLRLARCKIARTFGFASVCLLQVLCVNQKLGFGRGKLLAFSSAAVDGTVQAGSQPRGGKGEIPFLIHRTT